MLPTLQNYVLIAANRFDNPFNSWGEELYSGYDEHRRRTSVWARITLLFHAIVISGSLAVGQPILAVLISGYPLRNQFKFEIMENVSRLL